MHGKGRSEGGTFVARSKIKSGNGERERERTQLLSLRDEFHNLRPPFLPTPLAVTGHVDDTQSPLRSPSHRAFDPIVIHAPRPPRFGTGPTDLAAHQRVQQGRFTDVGAAEEGHFGELRASHVAELGGRVEALGGSLGEEGVGILKLGSGRGKGVPVEGEAV